MQVYLSMSVFVSVCVCVKWKGISLFILTAVCLTQDGKVSLQGYAAFRA